MWLPVPNFSKRNSECSGSWNKDLKINNFPMSLRIQKYISFLGCYFIIWFSLFVGELYSLLCVGNLVWVNEEGGWKLEGQWIMGVGKAMIQRVEW